MPLCTFQLSCYCFNRVFSRKMYSFRRLFFVGVGSTFAPMGSLSYENTARISIVRSDSESYTLDHRKPADLVRVSSSGHPKSRCAVAGLHSIASASRSRRPARRWDPGAPADLRPCPHMAGLRGREMRRGLASRRPRRLINAHPLITIHRRSGNEDFLAGVNSSSDETVCNPHVHEAGHRLDHTVDRPNAASTRASSLVNSPRSTLVVGRRQRAFCFPF